MGSPSVFVNGLDSDAATRTSTSTADLAALGVFCLLQGGLMNEEPVWFPLHSVH